MSLLDYLRPIWDTGEEYNTPEFLGNLAKGVGRTAQGLGSLASHVITNPTQLDDLIAQVPGALSQLPDYYREQYTGDVASKIYEDPSNYLMDAIDVLTAGAAAGRKVAPYASRFAEAASQPLGTSVRRMAFGSEAPSLGVGESLDRAIELARQGKFHNLNNEGGFARFRFDDAGGSARPKPGRGGASIDEGPASLSRLAEARQVASGTDDVLRQLDRGLDDIEGSRALEELEPWRHGQEWGGDRGPQGPGPMMSLRDDTQWFGLGNPMAEDAMNFERQIDLLRQRGLVGSDPNQGPFEAARNRALLETLADDGADMGEAEERFRLLRREATHSQQARDMIDDIEDLASRYEDEIMAQAGTLDQQSVVKSSLLGDRYGSLSNYVTEQPRPRPQSGLGNLRNERGSIQFRPRPEREAAMQVPPRVPTDAADTILSDLDAIDDIIDKARLAGSQGQALIDPDDLAELETYRATLEAQLAGEADRQNSRLLAGGIDVGARPAPVSRQGFETTELQFGPHPSDDLLDDAGNIIEEEPLAGATTQPTYRDLGLSRQAPPARARGWEGVGADPGRPGVDELEASLRSRQARSNLAPGNEDRMFGKGVPGDVENAGSRLIRTEDRELREAQLAPLIERRKQLLNRRNYLESKISALGGDMAGGVPLSQFRDARGLMDEIADLDYQIGEINSELPWSAGNSIGREAYASPTGTSMEDYAGIGQGNTELGETAGASRTRVGGSTPRGLSEDYDQFLSRYGRSPWSELKTYEQDIAREGKRMRRARQLGREDVTSPRRRRTQAQAKPPKVEDFEINDAMADLPGGFDEAVAAARATHGKQAVSAKQIAAEMDEPLPLDEIRRMMEGAKQRGTYYGKTAVKEAPSKVPASPTEAPSADTAADALRSLGWSEDEIETALGRATSKADTSASTKTTQPTTETGQSAGRRRGTALPSQGKLTAARKSLRKELGRNPSAKEIAEKVGSKNVSDIRKWLKDQPRNIR